MVRTPRKYLSFHHLVCKESSITLICWSVDVTVFGPSAVGTSAILGVYLCIYLPVDHIVIYSRSPQKVSIQADVFQRTDTHQTGGEALLRCEGVLPAAAFFHLFEQFFKILRAQRPAFFLLFQLRHKVLHFSSVKSCTCLAIKSKHALCFGIWFAVLAKSPATSFYRICSPSLPRHATSHPHRVARSACRVFDDSGRHPGSGSSPAGATPW